MGVSTDRCLVDIELASERAVQLLIDGLLDLLVVGVIWESENEDSQRCAQHMHGDIPTGSGRSGGGHGCAKKEISRVGVRVDEQVSALYTKPNVL